MFSLILDIFSTIGSKSYNPLLEASEGICREVYSIRDAKKASNAKMATYEATKGAMKI